MRQTRPLPSHEELLATFDYDPETGVLRWKAPRKKVQVGAVAGTLTKSGHITVGSREKRIYAHRIIWKMMTGEEPPEIDHRDNDGSNNRWANLRSADRFKNNRNQRKLKPATSKYRGVYWSTQKGTWHARIEAAGNKVHLGFFSGEEDAAAAYQTASAKYHGSFGNSGACSLQSISAIGAP